ncbi:MAG TPA: hypothetical protein VM124_01770 [Candidatus Limnocylindrales bacterium]|nr:hypothetical protein [Candidatus Limnocylindrales bacterium]
MGQQERLSAPQPGIDALDERLVLAAQMLSSDPRDTHPLDTPEVQILGAYLVVQSRAIFRAPSDQVKEATHAFYEQMWSHVGWAKEKEVPMSELIEALEAIDAATRREVTRVPAETVLAARGLRRFWPGTRKHGIESPRSPRPSAA